MKIITFTHTLSLAVMLVVESGCMTPTQVNQESQRTQNMSRDEATEVLRSSIILDNKLAQVSLRGPAVISANDSGLTLGRFTSFHYLPGAAQIGYNSMTYVPENTVVYGELMYSRIYGIEERHYWVNTVIDLFGSDGNRPLASYWCGSGNRSKVKNAFLVLCPNIK